MNTQILNRFEVNKCLIDIIENADKEIILISPYIKLNEKLKRALATHKHKKDFSLIVVYGKNEEKKQQSLSDADLDFLKQFDNIEIKYHKRLHAKLYANDFSVLITSMNLHDYSMNENIEIGVYIEMNLFRDIASWISNKISNSIEIQAKEFADYIISKSEKHFSKHTSQTTSLFGLFKSYGNPIVEVDNRKRKGYCIRKGIEIEFNPSKPYSQEAFASWNQYKNDMYKEKYCHACGKPAATSMKHPLCRDCFHKT